MSTPELTDKLLAIAYNDIDLVQRAIRSAAAEDPTKPADLEKVVSYILKHRKPLPEKVA
jgi:hypothetical protein